MPIPKVIYQTWKTKDLHPYVENVRINIQNLNPDYKMILYDDTEIEEFIRDNFDEYTYQCYKKLYVGAARADFWRYCMLYKNGGIYLDIDSEICRPLDELIQSGDQCIITREGNPGIFNNWIMIFEKGHPILKRAIEKCCYNIENRNSDYVGNITGPHGPFTESINETMIPYYGKHTHLYYEDDNELNTILNHPLNTIRCRFYGIDMKDFAKWKHDFIWALYQNNKHWTLETKIFNDE